MDGATALRETGRSELARIALKISYQGNGSIGDPMNCLSGVAPQACSIGVRV